MKNNWILISGVFGFLGVALGAFGAHGLKNKLDADSIRVFQTGVHYHMTHAIALFALSLALNVSPTLGESRWTAIAAWSWIFGIVVFSGSLYALTLTGQTKFGAITPIGGLGFLLGWISIAILGFRLSTKP